MLANRLIQLIENHARSLTQEAMQDIVTNENTMSFRRVPKAELEPRIAALYQNLGKWIGDPRDDEIRQEYEQWGRTRFRQGIPFSEIVYVLMLTKQHLRKFIREHGLVTFSGDRVTPDELIPVELYAIQELNYLVGDFFDRALYYLVRGYESAAWPTRRLFEPKRCVSDFGRRFGATWAPGQNRRSVARGPEMERPSRIRASAATREGRDQCDCWFSL